MIALPPVLAPPAPFPAIVTQTSAPEFVAPGVERAEYRMRTANGPIVVHCLHIDPREPSVRLDAVIAHDRLISSGETVSSMARRTGAIGGVNADYFDIGSTNQPLNIVVRNGNLVRTPSKRVALTVRRDRTPAIGPVQFTGTVTDGTATIALTAVNEYPPQGGVALLTSDYGGTTVSANGVDLVSLEPRDGIAGTPGTYTVVGIGHSATRPTVLAFGPAARALGPEPQTGDMLTIDFETTPALDGVLASVGGGPQLVAHGVPYVDPNSPAPEERDVRFPVSGAAIEPDGTLLLLAVDGRLPALSVGLTRPEFGALFRAFGAVDAMAFDSGGSATLVTRVLGDERATVVNTPSDGVERPVADGLFVYSDAPAGNAPRLILQPPAFAALPGALLAPAAAVVDAAGHRLRSAVVAPFRASIEPGMHTAVVHESGGPYTASLRYRTVDRIAALVVTPERLNPQANGTIDVGVHGFDARGNDVVLGDAVHWSADRGVVTANGDRARYRSATSDALLTVTAGGTTTRALVRVGTRAQSVASFATPADRWRFSALPRDAAGSVSVDAGEILTLAYDFTGNERAAYANALPQLLLPGEPSEFSIDVFGDGNGEALRVAFVNRFHERHALTLAKRVDWQGWQHCTVVLPPDLNAPVELTALYVVPSLGGTPVRARGTIRFRAPAVITPGSS